MKHLNENELIDLLFGERSDWSHLEQCDVCRDRYQVLETGLDIARKNDPGVLTEYQVKKRMALWKKVGYAAAAIFILFSILGFKANIGSDGFSVQFALFNSESQQASDPSRSMLELEKRMMQAINYQASLTAEQINQKFTELRENQYKDLVELSIQVRESMDSSEIQTGRQIALLNRDLEQLKTKNQMIGQPPRNPIQDSGNLQ